MASDSRPGLSPRWNTAAMVLAIAAILVLVPMIPPQGEPEPETVPTRPTDCQDDDTLCRAVDLLEELQDCDGLTPRQCDAVHMAAQGVAEAEGIELPPPTTTTVPPTTTTTTTSTTSSTTTTTVPPRVIPADQWADHLIDDLLDAPPTTAEGAGGET